MDGVLDDIGAYVGTFVRQNVNPLYNALGRNWGYYVDLPHLAAGQVMTYKGETAGPPQEWRVKNLLGVLVNAGDYLIQNRLKPFWLSQEEVLAKSPGAVAVVQPASPSVGMPIVELTPQQAAAGISVAQLAVYGALGLVGLLVLRRALG